MNDYWITFRIKSDANYQARYDAFVQAVIDARGDNACWAEPTSFWLVRSALHIEGLMKTITAPLNPKTDLVVARRVANDSSLYFGTLDHPDILREFLPNVKKLA